MKTIESTLMASLLVIGGATAYAQSDTANVLKSERRSLQTPTQSPSQAPTPSPNYTPGQQPSSSPSASPGAIPAPSPSPNLSPTPSPNPTQSQPAVPSQDPTVSPSRSPASAPPQAPQSNPQSTPQNPANAGQSTPDYTQNMMRIQSTDLPDPMRQTLQGSQFKGWEDGTLYRSKNNDGYLLQMNSGPTQRTYRFDANGKPINDF